SAHAMIYPTAKKDLLHSSRRCLQRPSRSRHWCHIHIPIACCPRPCSSRRTTESPRFDKRGSHARSWTNLQPRSRRQTSISAESLVPSYRVEPEFWVRRSSANHDGVKRPVVSKGAH